MCGVFLINVTAKMFAKLLVPCVLFFLVNTMLDVVVCLQSIPENIPSREKSDERLPHQQSKSHWYTYLATTTTATRRDDIPNTAVSYL